MTREEAIKNLEIMFDSAERRCARNIVIPDLIESINMAIEALKEHKQGEWVHELYGQYLSFYKCSNCGFHGDEQWICCPYCGARMKGGDEK